MKSLVCTFIVIMAVFLFRPIEAQTDTCPALVNEALQEIGDTCNALGGNTACYGYNEVTATFYDDVSAETFNEPADTVALTSLHTIHTSPLDEAAQIWGLALLNTRANLPNTAPGQNVVMLLMGDAQVENRVTPDTARVELNPVMVTTLYGSNLREQPSLNAGIVDSVSANTPLSVDLRSADGAWLRVARADGAIAWISREVIAMSAEVESLPMPEQFAPMQAFYFTGGIGQSRCSEATGTLYIQGPNRIQVNLQVNGVEVVIGSTLGLRYVAPNTLEFATLSGTVYVDSRPVPAGFAISAQVDENGTVMSQTFSGPFAMNAEQRAFYDLGESIPVELLQYPITVEEVSADNPFANVNASPSLGGGNAPPSNSNDNADDESGHTSGNGSGPPDNPGNGNGPPDNPGNGNGPPNNPGNGNGNGPPEGVGNGNDECTSQGNGNGNGVGNGC